MIHMNKKQNSGIRIMIAEDHPIVQEGLAAVISKQKDMAVVAEARNGRQAVELFRVHTPDVTLMDLRMPEMGGVDATRAICKEFPGARIIVLTTYDQDEDIYRALQAGARGYLLKEISTEELLESIRAVHAGARRVSTAAASRLAERITGQELTDRETDVLKLLVNGKTNKEIAAALEIAEGTVKGYVASVISKLGASDRTEAATTALRRGIVRQD